MQDVAGGDGDSQQLQPAERLQQLQQLLRNDDGRDAAEVAREIVRLLGGEQQLCIFQTYLGLKIPRY